MVGGEPMPVAAPFASASAAPALNQLAALFPGADAQTLAQAPQVAQMMPPAAPMWLPGALPAHPAVHHLLAPAAMAGGQLLMRAPPYGMVAAHPGAMMMPPMQAVLPGTPIGLLQPLMQQQQQQPLMQQQQQQQQAGALAR